MTKNISNPEALDAALKLRSEGQPKEIQTWINGVGRKYLLEEVTCFRRLSAAELLRAFKAHPWMLKAFGSNTPVYEFDAEDSDYVQFTEDLEDHVLPYLHSLLAMNQRNLGGTSFVKARTEGGKMGERQKIEEKLTEGPDDKTLVHKYGNGFAWWSLKSQKALRNESNGMNHCVGNFGGMYHSRIQRGEIQILSLRDANNVPHATIELEGTFLRQLKGNSNQGVGPKYRAACIGLLKDMYAKGKITSVNSADMARSSIEPTDLGMPAF